MIEDLKHYFVAYKKHFGLALVILIVVVLLFGLFGKRGGGVDDESVVLLDGLIPEEVMVNTGVTSGSLVFPSLKYEKDIETWEVDEGSKIYRSVGKLKEEGHHGSIEISGLLFSFDDENQDFVILTGRSHITFLMDTFSVENIDNDGIRTLFLNHLRGEDFLDVDRFPFAQFVVDEMKIKKNNLTSIEGRLKIKDVIETVSVENISFDMQGANSLFLKGDVDLSRYLWGIDAMPGVIDEFITVSYDLGLSRK